MTKDGITTFTTRPGLWIDPDLRLSTNWVIVVLLCFGIVLPFVDEIIDASSKWLSFAQMAMLCYALTVVTWGLERWRSSLARWFIVIVLSILVNLAFDPTWDTRPLPSADLVAPFGPGAPHLAVAPVWERYEYAFAVTEGGLYQSPNGGRAWRRANLDDITGQPSIVAVSPEFAADRTVFAGCETGELLISTDAGRSYHLAAAGFEAITALTFTSQGSLLLGTAEGICRIEGKELRSDTDLRGNGPPNLPKRPLESGEGAIRPQHDAKPDFSSGPPAEGLSTSSKPLASVLTLSAVEGSTLCRPGRWSLSVC